MKRTPLAIAAVLVLAACADDATGPVADDEGPSADILANRAPPGKTTLCHVTESGERRTITVSDRAVDAHLAHGDALGDCDEVVDGICEPEPYVDPDGCSSDLLIRSPDVVIADLRAALNTEDWDAVACNYHPDAFVIDDQGVLIGRSEIVSSAQSLRDLFDGVDPTITNEVVFEDVVRELYTWDGGWVVIPDGTNSYVVQNGMVTRQTSHGLIEFTGPPPDQE